MKTSLKAFSSKILHLALGCTHFKSQTYPIAYLSNILILLNDRPIIVFFQIFLVLDYSILCFILWSINICSSFLRRSFLVVQVEVCHQCIRCASCPTPRNMHWCGSFQAVAHQCVDSFQHVQPGFTCVCVCAVY